MNLLICVLGGVNLLLGFHNASRGKAGSCVLNAIAFGACLYLILERMV